MNSAARLRTLTEIPTWLVDLGDGDRVRATLAATVPEARSGAVEIVACEPSRLRLRNGSWVGRYEISVRKDAREPPRALHLVGSTLPAGTAPPADPAPAAFGSAEWRGYLPELGLLLEPDSPEGGLPALATLTDPDRARDVLERSIRLSGPLYTGFRLRGCVPSVVRHKPGSRCTILYQLQYPEGAAREGWPDSVVAKAYSDDKGQTAWNGMRVLWRSPMASSGVAIPEPFAYLADSRVLVQGPVGGQRTVKDSIRAVLGAGDNARAELGGQLRRHVWRRRHLGR